MLGQRGIYGLTVTALGIVTVNACIKEAAGRI
jgi:hypothetical protein